ncbi:N-acetyltransferase family protein [Streptomyces sp. NPDC002692]
MRWQGRASEAVQKTFHASACACSEPQVQQTRIAKAEATILLAELDGRPLALSSFSPSTTRPGCAELHSFYSHPDSWGSGIAAVLMAETLRRIRDNGFPRVHLWTLRETPQSRRFYTKCGFAERGTTRTFDFGDGNPLGQVEYEREC